MNQQQYLSALQQALHTLPQNEAAQILAQYEQRFIANLGAGRSEAEIIKDLGQPKVVAAKLIAKRHLHAFWQQKTLNNFWRFFISLIGLLFFNLFLTVPVVIYMSCLFASYAVALALLVGGSALTASGLSGVQAVHIEGSRYGLLSSDPQSENNVALRIDPQGIHEEAHNGRQVRHHGHSNFSLLQDNMSDSMRSVSGIALILGGILLFLLNLVISKYTLLGLKHYARLNWQILRGPQPLAA